MSWDTFNTEDAPHGWALWLPALGFFVFLALVVWAATTGESFEEKARREWPERCRSACRQRAVESAAPREALAVCLEGCP